MYLSDILKVLNIESSIDNFKINKIRIDSRLITNNDIFITINTGYKYIKDALDRGAKTVITDYDYNDNRVIKVDDTILVLGSIAKYIRSLYKGVVIAITGSCGKTTSKELLTYILSSKYKVLSTKDNLNNNIGVPSTLLNLDNSYDYVVLELGTNHKGEIKYLSNIVNPNISIITNIGYSHIGNFNSTYDILKEKLDIGGLLFLNGEDHLLNKESGIKVYSNDYIYECNIPYYKMNYYLVFKVLEYLGFNINEVYEIIKDYNIYNSRMDIYEYKNIVLIDDTYNASYDSVVSGLKYISKYNRKLVILSDMLELGNKTIELHTKLKEYLYDVNLITIGKYTSILNGYNHFNNIKDLTNYIKNINYNNYDVVYVKGAHKYKLNTIVNIIKNIL
jgi:UDP-N-acetylmuramoyl-tripeptide--D-alanyl-D-alanine ligase